jgi:hypothetical protein
VAKEAPQYKPGSFRIISLRTARRILHVEDCLEWGKVRFELWDYTRGQGAAGHADAYLNADTARVLAAELASGSLATTDGLEQLGGGIVKGQVIARVLVVELADTRNPIRISIRNGPGVRQPSGLISPEKGAKMVSLQILLSHLDAKRVGLALLQHLQAWATVTYRQRLEADTWKPETGAPSGRPDPGATSEYDQEQDSPPLYQDGTTTSDNPAEREAFQQYVVAEKTLPPSVDALRQWVANGADEA